MTNSSVDTEKQEFYVGYLPMPPQHQRFLMLLIPAVFFLLIGLSMLVSRAQRDPGATLVATGDLETWTGTLYAEPYPILVADDSTIYLVMGFGKFGVADRIAKFDGVRCNVDGWALARSDRHGIQLAPESNAIRKDAAGFAPAAKPTLLGGEPVRLIGEIVDGKCYLGAMKPGDGKGHKACAILCIDSGLPPLFVSIDPNEFRQLPLVLVDGKADLPAELLKLAGETVVLEGTIQSLGDQQVINTSVEQVQRWTPSLANQPGP